MYKDNHLDTSSKSLLEAIDFFSQNLSFEQILTYGYQFVHHLLGLKSSGIFVLEEDRFLLRDSIEASFNHKSFENSPILKTVATKFGRGMQRELKIYFPHDFIDQDEVSIAMPIIVKDQTLAYIICTNQDLIVGDTDLANLFEGVNQLLNNSASKARDYEVYKEASSVLDRKIFNLLFINHSTRALMREMNLTKLYTLCIDVIRELTASSVTGFALYNPNRACLELKGYKDILDFDDCYHDFTLKDYVPRQTLYKVDEDWDQLGLVFDNIEVFKQVKATYVVLVIKEGIQALVTLGPTVSGKSYSGDLLSQVESLMSSIYIAIKTAQYIDTIQEQKLALDHQLTAMRTLNRGLKNINSCESVNELAHIGLQTMRYDLDISKAMVVVHDGSHYQVEDHIGFDISHPTLVYKEAFRDLCFDQTYFDAQSYDLHGLFSEDLVDAIGSHNCLVSVPLILGGAGEGELPIGFILVFDSSHPLKMHQVLTLEAMANSMAPIVHHLQTIDQMERTHILNEKVVFVDHLNKAFEDRQLYFVDFRVYYKTLKTCPLTRLDKSGFGDLEIFEIDSTILHIDYGHNINNDLFDGFIEAEDMEDFKKQLEELLC